jgi:hypothetical protein
MLRKVRGLQFLRHLGKKEVFNFSGTSERKTMAAAWQPVCVCACVCVCVCATRPSLTRSLFCFLQRLKQALEDCLGFWLRHSLDTEHGGYYNCLDRCALSPAQGIHPCTPHTKTRSLSLYLNRYHRVLQRWQCLRHGQARLAARPPGRSWCTSCPLRHCATLTAG